MKKVILLVASLLIIAVSCKKDEQKSKVRIDTEYGSIIIQLYDSTIVHKQNFIEMIEAGVYDDATFHRIIEKFMIQGGELENNKNFTDQQVIDSLENKTVPFEVYPTYIHKRGALAAARMPDEINPTKASSATQFYIVQGTKYTNNQLTDMELQYERYTKQNIFTALINEEGREEDLNIFKKAVEENNLDAINKLLIKYKDAIEVRYMKMKPFKLNQYQRDAYTNIGGAPHLDGEYTVFGEVISGMEVVDSIAKQPTNNADQPLKEIKMKIKIIN
ncbi:MAG: peptidylprolyl isomerase [Lentimicrobiaceae bacterium]|nr:peptidylprolyl isomerase [Lentimicrobiaceae bacterium]